jgi:membrane protein implicated in regulation of membrane protease activity
VNVIKDIFRWMGLGQWFLDLTGIETIFFLSVIAGGFIFITRIILTFFLGGDSDGGAGFDADAGTGDTAFTGESDISFRLLSIQGISAFLIIFGLIGLAITQSGYSDLIATGGASVAGILTMVIVASVSTMMLRMQASGTTSSRSAVGAMGTVYESIPEGGTGQAEVRFEGRSRIYDAVAANKGAIPTGSRIKVVEVSAGSTVIVEKID